ncbi:PP2C family serine/threonine-protein phosphatase [Labrenzia sp. ac12]|uniref:PP2C family serine/threonine-protein phosphatase n=1 Tax=Labrenzia sp. THAF35 TaxID=2587854 RepID=UPI001267D813|nr:hypothetical protein FIU93_17810 [Labrenzia sp. THAF35]
MAWKWASASVIGTSHVANGDRLQDAYTLARVGEDGLLAIVSDGAGSAEFGHFGAWLVCRFLKVRFREHFQQQSDLPNDDLISDWVDELRDQIAAIARQRESTQRQFAATLAAILVTPEEELTLHIGDSAVVGRNGDEWDVLCWPENGEYASSTYFVTDDPEPRMTIRRQPRTHDAFAVFSDGVGDLALSHADQVAHTGFFKPMIRPVDAAQDEGRLRDLSVKLSSYLGGPSVCERTDDDKTLLLISGV